MARFAKWKHRGFERRCSDYYRYFDATAHAEFLYQCVEQTIEHNIPDEVAYLQAFDRFAHGSFQEIADMPAEKMKLLPLIPSPRRTGGYPNALGRMNLPLLPTEKQSR